MKNPVRLQVVLVMKTSRKLRLLRALSKLAASTAKHYGWVCHYRAHPCPTLHHLYQKHERAWFKCETALYRVATMLETVSPYAP